MPRMVSVRLTDVQVQPVKVSREVSRFTTRVKGSEGSGGSMLPGPSSSSMVNSQTASAMEVISSSVFLWMENPMTQSMFCSPILMA